jgi:hypothetical protein
MAVGNPVNVNNANYSAGALACRWRDLARDTVNFHNAVDGMAADDPSRATVLVGLGFAQADATNFVYLANVMNTVAQVYYGNATQGAEFNFETALSPLWGMS